MVSLLWWRRGESIGSFSEREHRAEYWAERLILGLLSLCSLGAACYLLLIASGIASFLPFAMPEPLIPASAQLNLGVSLAALGALLGVAWRRWYRYPWHHDEEG